MWAGKKSIEGNLIAVFNGGKRCSWGGSTFQEWLVDGATALKNIIWPGLRNQNHIAWLRACILMCSDCYYLRKVGSEQNSENVIKRLNI